MWPFSWRLHRKRGLRYWIISMLSDSPRNGSEIMKTMQEMTMGWWRPSPGTIYPLLQNMESEGLIRKTADGRYELTERTREEMNWNPWTASKGQGPDEMLSELEGYVSYFEDLAKTDKAKFASHSKDVIALRDRLSKIVQEGGENQ